MTPILIHALGLAPAPPRLRESGDMFLALLPLVCQPCDAALDCQFVFASPSVQRQLLGCYKRTTCPIPYCGLFTTYHDPVEEALLTLVPSPFLLTR